jgi:hypothetical protein
MRDGIALMGDEFCRRLDNVKRVFIGSSYADRGQRVSERHQRDTTAANAADGEAQIVDKLYRKCGRR